MGVCVLTSQIRTLKQRKAKGLVSAEQRLGPITPKLELTTRHFGDLYGRGWARVGGSFSLHAPCFAVLWRMVLSPTVAPNSCLTFFLFATCILLERTRDI